MDLLWILFMLMVVSISVRGSVPPVAKSRRGRQWMGNLETQTDCSFPVLPANSSNSRSATNSPIDQVSLCNFTTSGPHVDGVYSWQKGLASLANWLGGPTSDASKSTDGGYAYFETSSLAVQQLPGIQSKAWLKSPVYQATTPDGHCLRFAYNIQGASASQLRLLRVQMVPLEGHSAAPSHATAPLIVNSILMPTLASRQQHRRQIGSDDVFASPWTPFRALLNLNQTGWQEVVDEVWLSSDSTRGQWVDGHVTYSSPYPHAFIFEAVPNLAHLEYRGYVAVDNIQFSTGPCTAECEFNSDFCQWSNDPEGDFDWSLSRGSLWTSTGPIRDQLSSKHNFNFGGYAFIDSRQPHFAGSRASLTSDVLPNSDALCFIFWVHMFGAGVGRLRVLQKAADNSSTDSVEREIWQLSQSGPRDSWYRAQVTLASDSPFKIRLEATVGESGYGDIAVDSFRIENGSCPGLPEWAVNKGLDCTFQNSICGWVLTNSQPGISSMWTRSSADIISGRPDGHSQKNVLSQSTNSYMLFDTYQNGHKAGSRGFVSSPLQRSNDSHCLSFWFYMASASPGANPRLGALEVVLFEPNATLSNATGSTKSSSSVKSTTLWRLEYHQEEKWLYAQVSFVASSGGYVSFVGVRGDGVRGIIAIDDITLYRSSCQTMPLEAVLSPLDCTFDSNLCNWSVDSQVVQLADSTQTTSSNSSISSSSEETATEKEEDEITTATPFFFSRLHPDVLTDLKTSMENEPSIIFPVEEVSTVENDANIFSTTAEPVSTPTDGAVLLELIPSDPLASPSDPTAATTTVSRPNTLESSTASVENGDFAAGASTTTNAPTEDEVLLQTTTLSATSAIQSTTTTATSISTTPSTTTTTTTPATTETTDGVKLKESKVNPSDTIKLTISESGNNKDLRGVSGLYDEITSFGPNTIEVISTSRDGATKSIIISQPVRSRFRRSALNGWIGYNQPRHSRIVHYGRNSPPSEEERAWRRPMPIPHWLRSRDPEFQNERENSRGHVSPYSFHQPAFNSQRTGPKTPTKLFGFSTAAIPSPYRPFAQSATTSFGGQPFVREEVQQWILASLTSSLYGVRDHTLQLAEGGYVFLEGKGKPTVSRLFSPQIPGNTTQCLSFFFTMAYNSPNSTLTVYRFDNGPLEELWRVTSTALDRLAGRTNKSPWIPGRVPIPSNGKSNQTIVIEGSTDSGGIGLDDIHLQQVSCSSRP